MKERCKRNVIKVIVFLVVLAVGDRLGGYVLGRIFMHTQFRFAQIYAGDLSADIVFIGNSRGVHMFHRPPLEAVSGQAVANLSFNGMPAQIMPAIWQDYLDHHAAPKRLFVEVSCVGRKNETGSMERFSVLMADSSSIAKTLQQKRVRTYWFTRFSQLYRYNSELMWRSLFFLNHSDQDFIMDSVVTEDWKTNFGEERLRSFEPSQSDAEALRELKRIAEAHDVDVTFILAPYLPEYLERLEPPKDWLLWLAGELDRSVLDYSDALSDQDGFADPIHLNSRGAEELATRLASDGLLSVDDSE